MVDVLLLVVGEEEEEDEAATAAAAALLLFVLLLLLMIAPQASVPLMELIVGSALGARCLSEVDGSADIDELTFF